MGDGREEDLGFLADEDDNNRLAESTPSTDYEKMLCWLEFDNSEFRNLDATDRCEHVWQWKQFGRKEYKQRIRPVKP